MCIGPLTFSYERESRRRRTSVIAEPRAMSQPACSPRIRDDNGNLRFYRDEIRGSTVGFDGVRILLGSKFREGCLEVFRIARSR